MTITRSINFNQTWNCFHWNPNIFYVFITYGSLLLPRPFNSGLNLLIELRRTHCYIPEQKCFQQCLLTEMLCFEQLFILQDYLGFVDFWEQRFYFLTSGMFIGHRHVCYKIIKKYSPFNRSRVSCFILIYCSRYRQIIF